VTADGRRCGTPSGYVGHQRTGENPCDACTRAKAEYDKRWREAPDRKRKDRIKARAQSRAHQRLVHLFPDLYREFYLVEKMRLEDEA